MTVKLDKWHDELMVNVPGATFEGIKLALKHSLSEFLRRSGAWSRELPGIKLKPGRADYMIPKAPEGPILFMYGLYFEGRPLPARTVEQWLTYPTLSGNGAFCYRRYVEDPNRFTLSPTPMTEVASLVIPYAAFGYSDACQENLPDVFASQWYDAILSGAIYRLCSQPGKPYSDAAIALFHGKVFRAEIAKARDQAQKLFTRTETPFQFPAWA